MHREKIMVLKIVKKEKKNFGFIKTLLKQCDFKIIMITNEIIINFNLFIIQRDTDVSQIK